MKQKFSIYEVIFILSGNHVKKCNVDELYDKLINLGLSSMIAKHSMRVKFEKMLTSASPAQRETIVTSDIARKLIVDDLVNQGLFSALTLVAKEYKKVQEAVRLGITQVQDDQRIIDALCLSKFLPKDIYI